MLPFEDDPKNELLLGFFMKYDLVSSIVSVLGSGASNIQY